MTKNLNKNEKQESSIAKSERKPYEWYWPFNTVSEDKLKEAYPDMSLNYVIQEKESLKTLNDATPGEKEESKIDSFRDKPTPDESLDNWDEKRIDIIGQNGNVGYGDVYDRVERDYAQE